MFYLNVGFHWTLANNLGIPHGAIFLASGNTRVRLTKPSLPEVRRRLFDPQLYLAGLSAKTSAKTCARLATYPWFGVKVPDFDPTEANAREWESSIRSKISRSWVNKHSGPEDVSKACTQAIEFQIQMGCSCVILPSPIIYEREDEAGLQALWLDESLAAAAELDVAVPLLATVALHDGVLNEAAFEAAGFLDTIVDQVTARDGLEGVYIVIVQTRKSHPLQGDLKIQRGYLHLSERFSRHGYGTIITNFADAFGLVCLGVGASSLASGPSQALRRLAWTCFDDEGGGRSLPKFYSRQAIAEFLSESDLNPIARRRLLRRVRDVTPYSQVLMDTLAAGGSADTIGNWAEGQSNTATSHRHLMYRLAADAREISRMKGKDRVEMVRGWLDDAAANAAYIQQKFKGEKLPGVFAPSSEWLALFDAVTG